MYEGCDGYEKGRNGCRGVVSENNRCASSQLQAGPYGRRDRFPIKEQGVLYRCECGSEGVGVGVKCCNSNRVHEILIELRIRRVVTNFHGVYVRFKCPPLGKTNN